MVSEQGYDCQGINCWGRNGLDFQFHDHKGLILIIVNCDLSRSRLLSGFDYKFVFDIS